MSLAISSLPSIPIAEPVKALDQTSGGNEFRSLLNSAISTVENSRQAATQASEGFLKGENEELHSVILSTQKAELDLEMFLQVRNKIVQAYQEIMRMPV